jgi:hypothetical protein
MTFATLLFLLVAAHALADYPLQGDFLAQAKNRNTVLGKLFCPHALFAHSMIHGGFVLLLTGSVALAMAEVAIHAATDWLKCEQKISLNTDQAIHLTCKLVWAAITVYGVSP